MINLPKFKIGNLEINLIQGGMGVGISGKNLVSAVANEGGAGIIASVGLAESRWGLKELKNYDGGYDKANAEALKEEIREARKKSNGVIGVNIMHALSDYDSLVKAAVEENVDLIISGAGIPKDLPSYVGDKDIKLIPIVSSLRYTKLICQAWKRLEHIPDAIIIEGPKAGGHLGYSYEELINNTAQTLETIAKEVIDFANDKNNFEKPIPVIVAGGIFYGSDIKYFTDKIGATGVQMATRFVPTLECDAHDTFKWAYINATEEDIIIIKSPVGMPGRVVIGPFTDKLKLNEKIKFSCDYKCLKTCDPKISPYCIAKALVYARNGNLKEGFAFCGANAYRCTKETCLDKNGKFISVKTLMQRLSDEYDSAK